MVFADKVIDRSGSPTIWITEDLDQDPEDHAPASIRVVWKVIRWNCGTVRVTAESVDKIFDGCKNGGSHDIQERVPQEHLDEMITQIHLDLAGSSREQEAIFSQFDHTLTVEATEEPEEGEA